MVTVSVATQARLCARGRREGGAYKYYLHYSYHRLSVHKQRGSTGGAHKATCVNQEPCDAIPESGQTNVTATNKA